MSEIEEQIPLLENGTLCGEIRCRNEGFRTVFSIDVPFWESGVKKVWLIGADGGRLLLGTLMPENGRMRLTKTLSRSTLRSAGTDPPLSGEVNPGSFDGEWRSLNTFFHPDTIIQESVSRLSNGFWKRQDGGMVVRFSWRLDMPVPVTALFCLSEVHGGNWYIRLP